MRIVAVEAKQVTWPIAPTGAARGRHQREALIVGVRTEDGATGLGEAAPLPGMSIDALDDAARAVEDLAARLPFAVEVPGHATGIADRITAAPAARFAIETALLAVFAQRAHVSVASLWGAVPLAELACAVVVDDELDARMAHARTLKIKVGGGDFASELARIHRIARAAPGARLRIDANRTWPRHEVLSRLHALCALPIEYVEEPSEDAHELLAEPLPLRLALDESLIALAPAELSRALGSPSLAALVLKPTLLGGFARCLALAGAARRHGVAPVVTHALEGPIGTAACVELARAVGADVAVGLAPHPAPERAPRASSERDQAPRGGSADG
jgi:o-succinylbenzoate synthase